jgi:hypothetical protein
MTNYIRIACPTCDKDLRVREEYLGKRGLCNYCQHAFRIPRNLRVTCPDCSKRLKLPRVYAGRPIICPGCKCKFVAPADDAVTSADGSRSVDAATMTGSASGSSRDPASSEMLATGAPARPDDPTSGSRDDQMVRERLVARVFETESLDPRVEALEDDLRRERQERALEKQHHEELVTFLMERLEASQAVEEGTTGTAPRPAAFPALHAARATSAPDSLEEALAQVDRLAAELRAAYEQIARLDRDLALSVVGHAETIADFPTIAEGGGIAGKLDAARRRIEELLWEREQLQEINHSLTDHLVSVGVQPKALV